MSAGKGDKPRPINRKQYDANWEEISKAPSTSALSVVKLKNGKIRYSYTKKVEHTTQST